MVNYSKFFSDVALARKPSPIRVLTAIQAAAGPEMISLAGGQPNPLLFPINAVSFDIGKSSKILTHGQGSTDRQILERIAWPTATEL